MKNSLDGLNSIQDTVEEKPGEHEEKTAEIIQIDGCIGWGREIKKQTNKQHFSDL